MKIDGGRQDPEGVRKPVVLRETFRPGPFGLVGAILTLAVLTVPFVLVAVVNGPVGVGLAGVGLVAVLGFVYRVFLYPRLDVGDEVVIVQNAFRRRVVQRNEIVDVRVPGFYGSQLSPHLYLADGRRVRAVSVRWSEVDDLRATLGLAPG